MDRELAENRSNNVKIKDVMLGTLFRQGFDRLMLY